MVIDDVKMGQRVTCLTGGYRSDIGIVQVVHYDDGMVYVLWPVPGVPGRTYVDGVDPGDLELAP